MASTSPLRMIACAALLLVAPKVAAAAPHYALAMVGTPLYPSDFTHFNYANPDAPKGGTLRLGVTGSFDSLNPFLVRGQPPFGLGAGTMSLVYESLMARGWDEPFTLYPLLAESVDVPDDRTSAIFTLNPAARFSDGTPVTAQDVLFSFETLRDHGRPNHRSYYKKVASAEILSPTRIKFTFKPDDHGVVDRELPLIMGLMPILPAHDWADRDFNLTTLRPPVGSGPYTVASVDPGRQVAYRRNPDYWGRDLPAQRGLFNFDTIKVDYYRDDSIALQAFKAGAYDIRREASPALWATGYDIPAVRDGRVRLERLDHHRTEPATGFIFNTRRAPFDDPAFRTALSDSFDAPWVNRTLDHGAYHRVNSLFPNSELAAPPLPDADERALLEPYHDRLDPAVFTAPVTPPQAEGETQTRDRLLKAEGLLRDAGYRIDHDRLIDPAGRAVAFEILLADPADEKLALNWARSLRQLGIAARVHSVDSAQYQARLASFDYDVTINKWFNSLSPGNEQMYLWGSAAADQKGSRNYAGVRDPVVDALAASIPQARSRAELVTATHALDRVLMAGHYMVPLFYLGADDIASWTRVTHPAALALYGNMMESWWADQAGSDSDRNTSTR